MKKAVLVMVTTALLAPKVQCAPTDLSLSDEFLMTFESKYNSPLYTAGLVGKTDVEGLGVVYDVELGGSGQVELRLGAVSPVSDLTAYDKYVLTFTNTSVDDFYYTSIYMITGENQTVYESIWYPLMPKGNPIDMALDLTKVSNLNDVREIGFGLKAYIGQGFGLADAITVKVEDEPTSSNLRPVPEASTLMLFGSGLIGLFAIAKRKLPFLSK